MKNETRSVRRPIMGALDLLSAVVVLGGVWGALPARWWPVDGALTLVGALLLGSGVGLLMGTPWSRKLGVLSAAVSLVVGCVLVTLLSLSASQLYGLYGAVGRGGALILAVVAALIVPYLVCFPAYQAYVLLRERNESVAS